MVCGLLLSSATTQAQDNKWYPNLSIGTGISDHQEFIPSLEVGFAQYPMKFYPSITGQFYTSKYGKSPGWTTAIFGLRANYILLSRLRSNRIVLFAGEHYQTQGTELGSDGDTGFGFSLGGNYQHKIIEMDKVDCWVKIGIEFIGPQRKVFSLSLQTDF